MVYVSAVFRLATSMGGVKLFINGSLDQRSLDISYVDVLHLSVI